jgi:hypothetical protein
MFPAGRASITPMTLFDAVHLGSVQLAGVGWLLTRTLHLRHWLFGGPPPARWVRRVDRVACLLLALHMGAAWWGVHGGEWTAAWRHTAQETARVTGWNSGMGLLFNFVTLAVWLTLAGLIPRVSWPRVPWPRVARPSDPRPSDTQPTDPQPALRETAGLDPALEQESAAGQASPSGQKSATRLKSPAGLEPAVGLEPDCGRKPAMQPLRALLATPRFWGEVYLASMWLMAAVVFPRPEVRRGAVAALAVAALGLAWAALRRRRIVSE